jgi:hypothetical protein
MQVTDQDLKRRLRRPAQRPSEFFQRLHHYGLTISEKIQIYRGHLAITSLWVVSSLDNSNTVFFGTDIVDAINGWPLDAGKALALEVSPQQQFQSAFGMQGRRELAAGVIDSRQREPNVYLDLGDYWVTAASFNQQVRIFYSMPTEIPF